MKYPNHYVGLCRYEAQRYRDKSQELR